MGSVWARTLVTALKATFLHGWRFPARNRIIAGLCLATVIVEARSKSGALITADFALELGREVFAVPGEITSALSGGTNDLIRQGAVPLLSAEDVLSAIGIEAMPPSTPAADLSRIAVEFLVLLQDRPCGIDELVRASGRSSAEAGAALVELELAQCVQGADGIFRAVP